MVVSIKPELTEILEKIALVIFEGKLDKKILTEIAAFAAFRLESNKDQPNNRK